jgi:hypothetical protein
MAKFITWKSSLRDGVMAAVSITWKFVHPQQRKYAAQAALFFMKGNKNRTFNTNKRYSRKI